MQILTYQFWKYPPGRGCLSSPCFGKVSSESRRERLIRKLLRSRFSTLCPVSQPSQSGLTACPFSLHICKNLELSGPDHRDRAVLCQTSASASPQPKWIRDTVREHQWKTEFTAPNQQAPVPLVHQSAVSATQDGSPFHLKAFIKSSGE